MNPAVSRDPIPHRMIKVGPEKEPEFYVVESNENVLIVECHGGMKHPTAYISCDEGLVRIHIRPSVFTPYLTDEEKDGYTHVEFDIDPAFSLYMHQSIYRYGFAMVFRRTPKYD